MEEIKKIDRIEEARRDNFALLHLWQTVYDKLDELVERVNLLSQKEVEG